MSAHFGAPVENVPKICTNEPDSDIRTPVGWAYFCSGLTLSSKLPVPAEKKDPNADPLENDKDLVAFTKAVKGLSIVHGPTQVSYNMDKLLGKGTFGSVWRYVRSINAMVSASEPETFVVKLFLRAGNVADAHEVANIDLMNTVDQVNVSALRPSYLTTRMGAGVLQDINEQFCVVSPQYLSDLDGRKYSSREATAIVKACFQEVLDMYNTYNLLCFDLKPANMLFSCQGQNPSVHAADYGGYALKDRLVRATYPAPWRPFLVDTAQLMCEEICVYSFLTLFLVLVQVKDVQLLTWDEVTKQESDPKTKRKVAADPQKRAQAAFVKMEPLILKLPRSVTNFLNYAIQPNPPATMMGLHQRLASISDHEIDVTF